MRAGIIFAVIVSLSLLSAGCDDYDVIHDMARFDRAYIPALVLTSKKDSTGQSVVAVKRLRQDWMVLKAKYASMVGTGGTSDEVDSSIERADMLITTGEFAGAHKELESIREVLLKARRSHEVDYYLDYLTEFHSAMERAVDLVAGKEADAITKANIDTMRAILPDLRSSWQKVVEAPFDRRPFLFSRDTEKALMTAVDEAAMMIDDLEAAIRSGNRPLVLKHTMLVKKSYSRVFKMFGNFDSVSI